MEKTMRNNGDKREREFKKGEIVYREGDYEMCLYDILFGSVSLYQNYGTKEEIPIKELDTGEYFGEMELIEARPRTTTAVAKATTRVTVYSAEDFSACFTEKPAMVMAIMQQMSARIRELTRDYNEACRVVAEAVAAEKAGREKSEELQRERQLLSDTYAAHAKPIGAE